MRNDGRYGIRLAVNKENDSKLRGGFCRVDAGASESAERNEIGRERPLVSYHVPSLFCFHNHHK